MDTLTSTSSMNSQHPDSSTPKARTNGTVQQQTDKLSSAVSESSELTSEGPTASTSQQDDADPAFQSMDEDESQSRSSEEDEDAARLSGKASAREERIICRDLLNKKLEQLFVQAKIELTGYGRIPWTKLGETLTAKGVYISGFPEDLAPRVTNDHLTAGSAPSTWSLNRTRPLLALMDEGKIKILPRSPGRRVLFELTKPDGSVYDSTIGYSSRWLHEHMPSEFPSVKRARSDLGQSSTRSSHTPSRYEDASDDWSSGSPSEEDSNTWKPHRKRQRLSDSRTPPLVKSLRRSHGETSQLSVSTRSRPERNKQTKPVKEIKQGQKWKEGGIVKKVGKGWIVIEESTEEEEAAKNKAKQDSMAPMGRRTEPAQPQPASKKRKSSAPPETTPRPAKRPHQDDGTPKAEPPLTSDPILPDAVDDERRLKIVVTRIARLVRDAGYTGSKKIPWSTLPAFLAQKKLYITGFPYNCLPKIVNDEVKKLSSPPHWKPEQCAAMLESFNKNLVKIVARPMGRRVLFEAIGVDEKLFDSTCGFSATWIDTNLADAGRNSPSKKPSTPKKGVPKATERAPSPRPTLKLVIPDSGARLSESSNSTKNVVPPRTEQTKASKPDQQKKLSPSPLPRASIPTPIIFLQPPTPIEGQIDQVPMEKLRLEDSPMVESPTGLPTTGSSKERQSPSSLSPPPLPPPVDPIARPVAAAHGTAASLSQKPLNRTTYTFVIPPAKKKRDDTSPLSAADEMILDGPELGKGYNLALMFESPSRENPIGGLPRHLQPKVSSSESASMSPVSQSTRSTPMGALRPGEGWVVKLQAPPGVQGENSKQSLERVIRPALVKLFDMSGLSSPGMPIPWVMLPNLLCQKRLYISGFPRQCLPRVLRDKVEASSGPKSWSLAALQAMFNALKAGEVKIKPRARGRKVLFHLLPTDSQLEEGDKHGTDSTLNYSRSWLDEHLVDDPEEISGEDMQLEPSEQPIVIQRPPPLKRESSVWERFGKIKIEESESEDEEVVPAPPWKIAMEEFLRPKRLDSGESDVEASDYSASSHEDDESDEGVEYPVNSLLPSHIPLSLQNKGRIILAKDDIFEWIPNNPYATDCPATRMVWSASKGKWKQLPQMRDMDWWARGFLPREVPNCVSGKILSKGVCEHNTTLKAWECSFVGRSLPGELRWAPELCSWEWRLHDADGRRKWIQTPDADYKGVHEGMLSPMSF